MLRQRLIGIRAFYALILGQFVSNMGSAITRFGLSVWVFNETGSTTAYTMLLFFSLFPVGFGALIAGPLVDRWNRRWVMIASDTLAGVSTLMVALLFFFGQIELWHLYIALFVNGAASAFSRPASDASVVLLVTKERLSQAAGLSQMAGALEMILSSALAGFIVGWFGLGVVFVIDFVTFGFNILVLLLTVIPQPQRATAVHTVKNVWQEFVDGLIYVRHRPAMIYLLVIFAVTMFLLPGVAYSLVTPLVLSFAGEEALGLTLSSFGIGSLLGGVLLTTWPTAQRRMHGILAGMSAAGLAAILISLRESSLLVGIGFFVTGISFAFVIGLNRVIWQTKAAPHMLGRIFSLQLALGVGAQSFGILITGTLADRIFEPLLRGDGVLVGSVGTILGTGDGRGIALMFMLVGMLQLALVIISALTSSIHRLEDHLPDAETIPPAGESAPQPMYS